MVTEEIKPLYYFYGAEDLLVEEAAASLKKKVLTGVLDTLNSNTYYGASLDPASLMSEALTLPAMAPMRFILVKEAESLKAAELKALVAYIEDPSPTTCLVFTANTKKVDERSAFIKAMKAGGVLRRFNASSVRDIKTFIEREAARSGKKITSAASERLAAISGKSLRDIRGELTKIILFTGDKGEIGVEEVERAGVDVKEETVFGLCDAITARDLSTAMKILGKLSSEPAPMVLGAIARQFRALLSLKSLQRSGVPRAKFAPMAGVAPFLLDGYLKSTARFTEAELRTAFTKLREADLSVKSSGIPGGLVVTRLVIDLCCGSSWKGVSGRQGARSG